MSRQVQIRRGSATAHTNFTGAIGEITMDTTNKTLRVHDGETPGGNEIVSKNQFFSYITNCITKIPQDIKLELNNGILTLQAGSKVYVPNGVGIFDELSVGTDQISTDSSNQTRMYFYNGSYIEKFPVSACFSGITPPSGLTYMFWYDTQNNVVKKTSDGGLNWETGWSLPFSICTSTNGITSSVDQIFNGFGYIGSTVFAFPGVKALIPNGKNNNGTLKNTEFITKNVLTTTFNSNCYIGLKENAIGVSGVYKYDKIRNYNLNNNTIWNVCIVGNIDNNILSLKTVFVF